MKVLITGGAGFIGSHFATKLLELGHQVRIADNLSNCSTEFISKMPKQIELIEADLSQTNDWEPILSGIDQVVHCAAHAEIKILEAGQRPDFCHGLFATYRLMEAIRKYPVKNFAFLSSSAVYGEAIQRPTPESYGPLIPISTYAAAKIAAEAWCTSYGHSLGIKVNIFRLANIVGPRSTHGVILKLCQQLKNQKKIDEPVIHVLGDGNQHKSYVHVSDCIEGIFVGISNATERLNILNLSNTDCIYLREIAEKVALKFQKIYGVLPKIAYSGGDRAWAEDVPNTFIDSQKLFAMGWKPELNCRAAVEKAIDEIFIELKI